MSNSLQPQGLQSTRLLLHGILQARILEWIAISSSRGSSLLRDQTWISCIVGGYFLPSTAAAKLLQSSPILCDPIDDSPPGHQESTISREFSSVAQPCPALCDPMNHHTPGLPVHHQLPEFTQTHVHRAGDAIQPCRPLLLFVPFSSCPQSLPASESFPMSQFFAWGGQSTGVSALASVLPKNPRTDLLQNGLVGSPCSPRDSQESSPTPQFKRINSLVLSFLHSPTLRSIHDHWKNHSLD